MLPSQSNIRSITYGSSRYVNKGEDDSSSCVSHIEHKIPELSSFAIFDGHYGKSAANFCATHLNNAIAARYRRMRAEKNILVERLEVAGSKDIELIGFLVSESFDDALLVESIRAASRVMDEEIRKAFCSGTTSVSAFIRPKEDGNGVRVIISNIGDSRCVLFSAASSSMKSNMSPGSQKSSTISSHRNFVSLNIIIFLHCFTYRCE